MPPTPKAADKRAPLPRQSYHEKGFAKDWQRLTRSGRYNMNHLKEAMLLLIANAGPLPPEWRDHELTGNWGGHRECHVGGDFLLIYRLDNDRVVFIRAGTHADLFE
jgi:mRNA interferase YafQ